MEVEVNFYTSEITVSIDLKEFGYGDKYWDDLSEEEQNECLDIAQENVQVLRKVLFFESR